MSLVSRTFSIRVTEPLLERMEELARLTNRSRNSIVVRAIEDYMDRNDPELLMAEARRQSLLARKQTHPDDEAWPDLAADDTGWT